MDTFIVGALVNNQFGVLTRISTLFSRRGYNIDSLVVGVTDNPELSRMTIVASGDEQIRNQLVKQLGKLYDVVKVDVIPANQAVIHEHMLVKLQAQDTDNSVIIDTINNFGAKIVDFSADTITAEVTGELESNTRFLEQVEQYGVLEISRTGAQAIHRGAKTL